MTKQLTLALFSLLIGLLTAAAAQAQLAIETEPATLPGPGSEQSASVLPNASVQSLLVPHPTAGYGGELVGGVGLYYLKPFISNNTAYTAVTGIGTPSPFRSEQNFSWDYAATPAVWLGWVGQGGLGVRGRYFYFDQGSRSLNAALSADQIGQIVTAPAGLALTGALTAPAGQGGLPAGISPAFGSPGIIRGAGFGVDQLNFNSNLKLNVVDLEATQYWQLGQLWLQVAGGGRYLHSSQDYTASLYNNVNFGGGISATESQRLELGRNFNGAGITAGLEARRQLGTTGLALYGNVRGSLLVGSTHESLSFTQVVIDPAGVVGGNQNNNPGAIGNREQVLPVTELEFGCEWRSWRTGRFKPFVRAGVVDQTYFNLGSSTQSNGNLSLFGVQFMAGLNY